MKKIVFVLFLMFSITIQAQIEESREIIDKAGKLFTKSSDKAIDYLFDTNPEFRKKNPEFVTKLKKEFDESTHHQGKLNGYEIQDDDPKRVEFSKRMHKYGLILYYDLNPIYVEISLYKPSNSWMFYDFKNAAIRGFQVNEQMNEDHNHPHPH